MDKKILDVTCGARTIWFNKNHPAAVYCDKRYAAVLAALTGGGSIREMSDVFMKRFEKPADQSDKACAYRANLCEGIYKEFAGSTIEAPQEAADEPETDTPTTPYWPPRVLCEGMQGADVAVLQAHLQARGYNCGGISGVYSNKTKCMVMAFQAENGLASDGIAGPKTFRVLGVVA